MKVWKATRLTLKIEIQRILDSWPPNLPVFVSIDSEKILSITSENEPNIIMQNQSTLNGYVPPSGKELKPLPPPCQDLCSSMDERIEGHVLYLGDTTSSGDQEAWTKNFTQYVGSYCYSCFGRCGQGCINDSVPDRDNFLKRLGIIFDRALRENRLLMGQT